MAMAHSSFEDIAVHLVEQYPDRAKFQVRDIAERLARAAYTEEEARQATHARQCLVRELLKTH